MHKRLPIVLVMGLTIVAASGAEPEPAPQGKLPPGFSALFNGKDLTGWHGLKTMDPRQFESLSADEKAKLLADGAEDLKKHWRVEDGVIVNDGQGAYLTSDKDYGDIELLVDFKIGPKGDSGVYLRGTPQVQIWDFTEPSYARMGADKGSGGLWNNSPGAPGKDPLTLADNPIGQWNTFRIIQVGARTTIYLNDKLVVDHAILENYWKRALADAGPRPDPAPDPRPRDPLAEHRRPRDPRGRSQPDPGQARRQTASGRSSTARTSPTGPGRSRTTRSRTASCDASRTKGGTIYYNQELTDFMARVEFKLPPAGNNGLAIRYPGHGDTAYDGMCELQILDDGHPKYAKSLDPRQAHGSAYGMVAAQKGYLRPVGQWNFEEVTVKGSTIKVELNGTVILDTDLSKVKEFMANSRPPWQGPNLGLLRLRRPSATRSSSAMCRSRPWNDTGSARGLTIPR